MSLAALLLLVAAPTGGVAASDMPSIEAGRTQAGGASRAAPVATARARAQILRGESVVFARIEEKRSPRTTIRRDGRGVTWVEFS